MKKQRTTKRALLLSALSLLMCVSMLIGSTFAWFTDSVQSGVNKIQAGNLDIALYHGKVADPADDVEGDAKLFTDKDGNDILWEPGAVAWTNLKVANEGTLALKYQLAVNFENATANANGETLAKVLKVGFVAGGIAGTTREAVLAEVTQWQDLASFVQPGTLEKGKNDIYGIVICWEPSAIDNAFNLNNDQTGVMQIDLGIKLLATQNTVEQDSFGDQYDEGAAIAVPAANVDAFFTAIDNGNDVLLTDTLNVDAEFLARMREHYGVITYATASGTTEITKDAVIDGNGITVYRTEETLNKPLFNVASGYTLTLSNITLDGGAVWTGERHATLDRGTVNSGLTAGAALVATNGNANVVLNENAVLQNNDGSIAVSLATRGNGTLTMNGAQIVNNNSAAGAVWLGGAAIVNEGSVIKGNQGGIGGVFRSLDNVSYGRYNISVTVNGGKITNNYATTGGVIWSGNGLTVTFNGGEIAYNSAASAGGVIWGGSSDKYYITGDVEIHDNTAGELGNVIRFNYYKYPSLEMTGGKVYNNTCDATPYAFWCYNNYVKLLDGEIKDDIYYTGGVDFTMGDVQLDGSIHFSLDTGHKRILLAESFSTLRFTVADDEAHYSNVHFVPAAGYTYTEGDEAKLICLNEGYSTYWDAASGTFRLQAD